MLEATRAQRLLAEGLGTALLVATVVGSGIMADKLAGGNQAIALLGNTIPTGAILVVLITVFGPISGAHFNPAVTLVFAARGETHWGDVPPYIVVQCAAGIIGTALAHLMYDLAPLAIGVTVRTYKCKTSTFAEQIRASSDLRSIGLNQIEPVGSRAGCQLPPNLHVASPSSEPRTTIPTSVSGGGAAPGPS